MSPARRTVTRPRRPDPVCESCGAEVWWAWSLVGKCWAALAPRRLPLDGTFGTFEVWRDAHGGLLCTHLAPGVRGDQEGSWRGVHHNAACGTWRTDVTRALVREASDAVPVMTDGELVALGQRLRLVGDAVSAEIRRRALARPGPDVDED